ncbi:hypothetical protein P3602_24800 [Vibrio parahaemolyticus]|nr:MULTISPECIES: hypothetical protein [Vibrio]MDF5109133.1 hypothetical protein [Vibrio parahaemolyticus]MDF5144038.1 hypothetical protein [Vibrio parahaemolyticus]MDF5154465.1 hypothetical protein [Vibrio parahaemolyticus]MDW1568237.1 hypothetical protein [Vibrio sp. YT-15]MDW1743293.1 hypothetical protein [Vibrio sp. Vb2531]
MRNDCQDLSFWNRLYVLFTGKLPTSALEVEQEDKSPNSVELMLDSDLKQWVENCSYQQNCSAVDFIQSTLASVKESETGNISVCLETVCSRFRYVFEVHKINPFDIPLLISSKEIPRSVLMDDEKLIDTLNDDVLAEVSECFNVDIKWLKGTGKEFQKHDGQFKVYKNVGSLAAKLAKLKLNNERVELQFVIGTDEPNTEYELSLGDSAKNETQIGVIFKRTKVINGKEIATYSVSGSDDWNYKKCRKHYKLLMMFCKKMDITYSGLSLSKDNFNKVFFGELPAILVAKFKKDTWYPTSYVSNDSEKNPDFEGYEQLKSIYGTREDECHMTEIEHIERAYRFPHLVVDRDLFEDGLYEKSFIKSEETEK